MTNAKKKGQARLMYLKCNSCTYVKEFCTSKKIERNDSEQKGGGKFMEVNLRAVYVMRAIGVGYTPLKKLCCYLNMPVPKSSDNCDNCDNISKTVKDATSCSRKSMTDAAKEVKGENEVAEICFC